MPFLPDNLVNEGWSAFGFNPWIWPDKLPDGGDVIIRRTAHSAWSDAFNKAYLQQAGIVAGLVTTPVAPDSYYSFNFDTGALKGPYAASTALWSSLPVAPPSTVGFTIKDPTTGVIRPLDSADINKPIAQPPTSPISPPNNVPLTGTAGDGTPIAGPLGTVPGDIPIRPSTGGPLIATAITEAAASEPSAGPGKYVIWLIGAAVIALALGGG
jgi:hypothetical protein